MASYELVRYVVGKVEEGVSVEEAVTSYLGKWPQEKADTDIDDVKSQVEKYQKAEGLGVKALAASMGPDLKVVTAKKAKKAKKKAVKKAKKAKK